LRRRAPPQFPLASESRLGGQMADADLRPMSLGEVLDRTFKLYKNHFWLFTGITALPFFLVLLAEVAIAAFAAVRAPGSPAPPFSPGALGSVIGGGGIVVILYLLMFGAAHAATVFAVSDVYLSRPVSIRGSFARVGWKALRVLLVYVLIILLVGAAFFVVGVLGAIMRSPALIGIGFLLLFVPAIILVCRTAVAVPTAMLENAGAVRSLERSLVLTKGHAAQIFVIFLLVVTFTYVAILIFQVPVMVLMLASLGSHKPPSFGLQMLQHLGEFVSQVLAGPIGTIAFSLMYYNLRVRKEAFDIQHLMTTIGTTANPTLSTPSTV
jgi:Membrane domain of glycerophosphoryl diester phosphodiesterase